MTTKLKITLISLWVLVLVFFITIIPACASNEEAIYGYYEYERTIYNNPASSFLMLKETAPDYIITADSFTIINTDGTEEIITTDLKRSNLSTDELKDLFMPQITMPDISGFKRCSQYVIKEGLSLYVMDDQIWLAQIADNTIWNTYKLRKIDDI